MTVMLGRLLSRTFLRAKQPIISAVDAEKPKSAAMNATDARPSGSSPRRSARLRRTCPETATPGAASAAQRRLEGFEEKILSLYVRDPVAREIKVFKIFEIERVRCAAAGGRRLSLLVDKAAQALTPAVKQRIGTSVAGRFIAAPRAFQSAEPRTTPPRPMASHAR